MTITAEVQGGQLAHLFEQLRAGQEIVLTQGHKPVAKLVPMTENSPGSNSAFRIRARTGHKVLTPVISQEELAEEMFDSR